MSPALPSVYPLIQAPMAGVQDNRLALAVCRAGGLGSIPAALLNALRSRAEAAGDSGFTPLWRGQNPGGCHETGAEALTRELCRVFAAA